MSAQDRSGRQPGNVFARAWRRLSAPGSEQSDRDPADHEAVAIDDCRDREKVTLQGTLSDVRTTTCDGTPSLQARLGDGSGTVTVIWLGRNAIPGIETGRTVRIIGRVSCRKDRRVVYNPRYELTPDPR